MPKASAPKPSKKPAAPAEEPEVDEEEVSEPVAPKKSKKAKPSELPAKKDKKAKKAAEEPEPEMDDESEEEPAAEELDDEPEDTGDANENDDDGEEEDDDGEEEEEDKGEENDKKAERREKARKRSARRKSARIRNNGWRKIAITAGYGDEKSNSVSLSSGADALKCLLSPADAKRLMTFVPATPGADSFDKSEFETRAALFKEGVPLSAANETQVRCDLIMRFVLNSAALRDLEMGKMRITPSVMRSVLRPYIGKTRFTSVVAPLGLVQHAVKKGAISGTTNDTGKKLERSRVAHENKKIMDKIIEEKNAMKRKRSEAAAPAAAAVA